MYYIQKKARVNSRRYGKTVAQLPEIADVISYLKENNIQFAGTPYIFTHINLSDGSIITQDVLVGGNKLITSPQKLADALKTI